MGGVRRRGGGLLAIGLAWVALAGGAGADDAPKDPGAVERRKRQDSLVTRARKWLELRKEVVYKCGTCGGDGTITREKSRGARLVLVHEDCPDCVRGGRVNTAKARTAYFEAATPEWRSVQENVDATQTWVDSLPKDPAKALLKAYKIEETEMVGERHGVTRVHETRETEQVAPFEYRWVLADDPKTKAPTWYLWHDSDGGWGAGAEAAAPGPAAPRQPNAPPPADPTPAPSVPLGKGALEDLAKRLAVADVKPGLDGASFDGETLVVQLRPDGLTAQDQLDEVIAKTIIPATKVAMSSEEKSKSVRLVFLARYRDKLGEVSLRAYETATMDRDLFARIKFDRLSRQEALDLFTREQRSYRLDGLILWWKE